MATVSSNPTTPVRKGEDLDWLALDKHLKSVLPHLEGEAETASFPEENPT